MLFIQTGLDTEVGQVGMSLHWILLECIQFLSSVVNYGGATLDNEPEPTHV